MTPQDISIGTRLELEMLNNNGERIGNLFISQLLEHQDDGMMVISAPISGSRVIFVPDGITLRLAFIHQIQGLLGFTAEVVSREYRGKVAVLIIRPDMEISKIQRRMHYRLEIVLDATIRSAEENDVPKGTEKPEPALAYTKNISGSGACIVTETDFPKNTSILVELKLTDGTLINAKGVIVRKEMIDVRKGRSYELGVIFIEISNKDQNALIKFIFEQQRLLLKKDKDK